MRGDPVAGSNAAALVDGDIDDDGTGAHGLDHVFGYELRGLGPRHQYCANQQVCLCDPFGDVVAIGHDGGDAAAEDIIQIAQALAGQIDHGHAGTEPDGYLGGIRTDYTAADDHDLSRGNSADSAQQDTGPAIAAFQELGADLYRHASGNLAHGGEQRQASAVSADDGFVGDACHLVLQQCGSQLGLWRQVQIGEEYLALMEEVILLRQGFFYFDDHLCFVEQLLLVS